MTREQRTITFNNTEAYAIFSLLKAFEPRDLTESIEIIFQELLESDSFERSAEIANAMSRFRQMRDFYAFTLKALRPVFEAYKAIPFDIRSPWEQQNAEELYKSGILKT